MPDDAVEIPVCERCGAKHERQGHPTCSGHKRDGNENTVPCFRFPINGATVCPKHGGAAPQVKAAAATRVANEHISNILDLVTVSERHRSRAPEEQLLEEVARSAQAVEWLAQQVSRLHWADAADTGEIPWVVGIDDATGDLIEVPNRARLMAPNHQGNLTPHPFWQKLDEERDRHARMCKLAIDAGISERIVRLSEAQAARTVGVILHVIEALKLSPADAAIAKRAAAEKMRALGPGTLDAVSRPVDPPAGANLNGS